MKPAPATLLVVDDEGFVQRVGAALRAGGDSVRTVRSVAAARRELLIGDVTSIVLARTLPDEDALEFIPELRASYPTAAVVLVTDGWENLEGLLGFGVDDVVGLGARGDEVAWRVRAQAVEQRRVDSARQRDRFLRGVVRLADTLSPYIDVPTLASAIAPGLLGLPGVEAVRIELDGELPGEPPLVVLEAGRASALADGSPAQRAPLRGIAGQIVLAHRSGQDFDDDVRDALGTLVGASFSAARQFGALKERQLRLERGYVDRHRKLSRVSGRLERLSEARDSFLALLSHDLRSPLAVVLGQVELIEEGLVGAAQLPKSASTIGRQAQRMLQMVEELLDRYRRDDAVCSPIEAGDAGRMVSEMVEALRPLAAARRQTLAITGPPAAPIEADLAAIREVLANLLENAVRHAPVGSTIQIDIATTEREVAVAIRDQGAGFGAAPATGGSGLSLGLAASARIVADAGGALRTADHPAGGGVATLLLPLAAPQVVASAVDLFLGEGTQANSVREALGRHWECRSFDSLVGALERMRRQPPAVLIVEQSAHPEVVAFVRRLKSDAELASVPVIALGTDLADLYDAGALAALVHPVSPALLVGHVRRALRLVADYPTGDEAAGDVLTGLPNAKAFSVRVDAAVAEAAARGAPVPLVLVRIEDLKLINRQHGWLVGDQLLLWMAGRLRERLRPGEIVARVDAESFALALPGRTIGEAQEVATELGGFVSRARPRLGLARVDVRVSTQALDIASPALGGESLVGALRGGGKT
ncbi:MAG: diguanylate cyclase [Myxococcales bacterium]|nr:diguanylate cyclase [Myxococcales bacterium]